MPDPHTHSQSLTLILGTILNSLKIMSMLIIRIMFAREKNLSISLNGGLLLDLRRKQQTHNLNR